MLGKIPPFALWIGGPVLVAAVAFAFFRFLISPEQGSYTALRGQIQEQQKKADLIGQAKSDLESTKRDWEASHDQLAQKLDERSIPVSMAHPMIAMVNLWREAQEDLPQLVQEFIRRSGCIILRGHPGWSAPLTPFPATTSWIEAPLGVPVDTSHAVLQPAGGAADTWAATSARGGASAQDALRQYTVTPDRLISTQMPSALQVAGTMASIERLYKSLRNFPRVLTIQNLILRRADTVYAGDEPVWIADALGVSEDEVMVADIAMSIWILCEAPEAAGGGAAAGGAGAPGGMGGGMGMPGMSGGMGMPGMGGGMPGMSGAPSGAGGGPGGPSAKGDKGGGASAKGDKGSGSAKAEKGGGEE